MDCPHCGLVNPVSACRCDCGYDFDSQRLTAQENAQREQPGKWISRYLLIMVAASIVAFVIVGFANGGRLERILTKAMVLGFPAVFALVTGLAMMLTRGTRRVGGFICAAGVGICLGVFFGAVHVLGWPG